MILQDKQVTVTGGGGFIGSHLVEELISRGCRVRAFVHYNSFSSWGWIDNLPADVIKNIDVFAGDVRDPNGVREALKNSDVVFHLAALIGIPYSYHSPDTYLDTNIRGTLNVLQAVRDLGIPKMIHTSTSEIYGTAQFVPITEEHPVNPQSPYAATKSAADFMALTFYRSFNTPVTVVRPFNTYGPRQSARAVIPSIITQVLSGKTKLSLGALSPTRDLNFVTDTAKGFIMAAESDIATGEVINLGTGREIAIGDLAYLIAGIIGKEITIDQEKERMRPEKSEVERLLADASKAERLTGWKPEHSLEEGLEMTIRWFSQKENLEKYKSERYNV